MSTKSQHNRSYKPLPEFLRSLREEAGLTQRGLAALMDRPQSWIYKSEVGIRRVDITEFIAWSKACGLEPREAFDALMNTVNP